MSGSTDTNRSMMKYYVWSAAIQKFDWDLRQNLNVGNFCFLLLRNWSHLKLWHFIKKKSQLRLLSSRSHLVHVSLTSILEKGTPFVMVDILIFSSEISFLSFFTSSIVWHLFCITWGLNFTSGCAENFPQFPDPLSYEQARVAFPDLEFHTEPSLPGSCSYPRNSFGTNVYIPYMGSNESFRNTKRLGSSFAFVLFAPSTSPLSPSSNWRATWHHMISCITLVIQTSLTWYRWWSAKSSRKTRHFWGR